MRRLLHLLPPHVLRVWASRKLKRHVSNYLRLLAPPPSNFKGQHRQATPPGLLELRVVYLMLVLGRGPQGPRSTRGRRLPSRLSGLTSATSTATCTPPKAGSPFATTSSRRPSVNGSPKFRSRRKTLVATRAPASRQTRAAARSRGQARRTSTRLWGSCLRALPGPPHRQALASNGSGAPEDDQALRARLPQLGVPRQRGAIAGPVDDQVKPATVVG